MRVFSLSRDAEPGHFLLRGVPDHPGVLLTGPVGRTHTEAGATCAGRQRFVRFGRWVINCQTNYLWTWNTHGRVEDREEYSRPSTKFPKM